LGQDLPIVKVRALQSSQADRPLRVGIDCQLSPDTGIGGIETFLVGLIHALGRLNDDPTEFILLGPSENQDWLSAFSGPNQRIVSRRRPLTSGLKSLGRRIGLAAPLRRLIERRVPDSDGFIESLGCDVIHFPRGNFVRCAIPAIYNPHDLQYLHYPEYFSPNAYAWRQRLDRAALSSAETVTVSSNWGKSDIIRHFGIDPEKIQVIPGAPPMEVYSEASKEVSAEVSKIYKLRTPFAFYPAMTWEHKNHLRLLEALALLRDKHGIKVRLICTGSQNDFWGTIECKLNSLCLQDQVRFLGLVPAQHVRAIYRLAEFVVIPTLFEATSGPLLEAWLEGTPATCSTATSLPEQAGEAALLFDPLSVESIAEAVGRMSRDPGLRQRLKEQGARRLVNFNWERTARAYRAVYRRAAGFELSENDRRLLACDWSTEGAYSVEPD
jgi:glycosyltransferase involved in cell wall biosynthesis